jgi:hypothetical protein
MPNYFILMDDVIGSRRLDPGKVRRQLKDLLSACNRDLRAKILSPYTTTLGDEFQGVPRSLRAITESAMRALRHNMGSPRPFGSGKRSLWSASGCPITTREVLGD